MTRRAGYSQPAAAHPRVCGENLVVRLRNAFAVGSSPRVRGKPHARGDRTRVRRLIPARAGKIRRASSRGWARRAHPRACGENRHLQHGRVVSHGSSPRVRGKHEAAAGVVQIPRLIPARAGKTPRFSHPARAVAGSSPRVRGKHDGRDQGQARARLIPARAGKTSTASRPTAASTAHPRACGKNRGFRCHVSDYSGSSPRVRGKRRSRAPTSTVSRLIPARAGKTLATWRMENSCAAHPRACGENVFMRASALVVVGSSPHVRGKPPLENEWDYPPWLIPARAGKTTSAPTPSQQRPAHPRACGENAEDYALKSEVAGSSPRVRGKHDPVVDLVPRQRLIPARAGKT